MIEKRELRFLRNTVFIFMSMVFFSCENSIEKINTLTDYEKLPSETGKNIEVLYSDSGLIKVKLQAAAMERYSNEETPYTEFKEGVKVVIYNEKQEPESQITCKYAINFEKEGKMEARNDVVVINKYGEKLNTEHIIWNEKEEQILSDEFVKITTKDEIIMGEGLEANQDFTKYKILKIKGTIQLKDESNEAIP